MFALSRTPIDELALKSQLRNRHCGALVTFEGWVRDHNDGKGVKGLSYSAYESMAVKEGTKIIEKALKRYEIVGAQCVHRTGHLDIGDLAVWVGVSSAHRDAAFKACRFIIDEVKTQVPIWKQEFYSDSETPLWLRS